MAQLDDIVQKILLEGDNEVLDSLKELAEKGEEAFEQLSEAAEKGSLGMGAIGTALGTVAAGLSGVSAAVIEFVDSQDEATQKFSFMAEAFGVSAAQLQGLEAAFTESGVSAQAFERLVQRMSTEVARDWSSITDNVRNASSQQEEAQNRVAQSSVRVQEATNAVANNSATRSSEIVRDNEAVAEAMLKVEYAAQDAASSVARAQNSSRGATLALEAAEERLQTLDGHPPSDAQKQGLQLRQAQLAVDQARQQQTDAITAAEKAQEQAVIDQQKAKQALADAERKQFEDDERAQLTELQLQQAQKQAILEKADAEDRAYKTSLQNLTLIGNTLKGLGDSGGEASQGINLADVSLMDLRKAIELNASDNGQMPTGFRVLAELSKTLANDTDHLIDNTTRLALVQQTAGAQMRQTGADASELLKVIERGPGDLEKYVKQASAFYSTTEEAQKSVEEFRSSMAQLEEALRLTNQSLAAMASPALAKFLDIMREGLTSDTGLLHAFVQGLIAVGETVKATVSAFYNVAQAIDKAFNVEPGTTMKIVIAALVTAVGLFASAWLAIPAIIAVVVTAVGYVVENWDKVKEAAANAWEAVKDSTAYKFVMSLVDGIEKLVEKLKEAVAWWAKITGQANAGQPISSDQSAGAASEGGGDVGEGKAGGGLIEGPGTGTSDSVPIRASRGEFMVKASAVGHYGVGFMHALNNMLLPGFAGGGLIGGGVAPIRSGSRGGEGPYAIMNLTIGEHTFSGLKAPQDTAQKLQNYAINRQTTAAGRNPSWVK